MDIRFIAKPFMVKTQAHTKRLNVWCEFLDHHPNKSTKDSRGRPSCLLSHMQKL